MTDTAKSTRALVIPFFSKFLILLGTFVFLLGDKFLEKFAHFGFALGEVIGILSGLLLCAIGYAIGRAEAVVRPDDRQTKG